MDNPIEIEKIPWALRQKHNGEIIYPMKIKAKDNGVLKDVTHVKYWNGTSLVDTSPLVAAYSTQDSRNTVTWDSIDRVEGEVLETTTETVVPGNVYKITLADGTKTYVYGSAIEGTTALNYMRPMGTSGAGLCVCTDTDLPTGMVGLSGYDDPENDNFGNYQYLDGSIMCCVGKFFYRINNSANIAYTDLTPNDINIVGGDVFASRAEAMLSGYALHRAFIDGGEEKSCVFVDKYMCSKNAKGTGYVASSLAGGLPLSTSSDHNPITGLTACSANTYYSCVTAAHARDGEDGAVNPDSAFFASTRFIESALAMQSMAHAQACTSTAYCAWWGASNNFPKGCNNNALRDVNDTTVLYESDGYSNCAKTGTGDPFAKTTHNGQACGVADLNGLMYEVNLGLTRPGLSASDTTQQDDASAFYVLKESVEARTLTAGWNGTDDAWGDATHLATLYDQITLSHISSNATMRFGNATNQVLDSSTFGDGYTMTAMGLPKDASAKSSGGTDLFGNDYFRESHRANLCVLSCYSWNYATNAGVFACLLYNYRTSSNNTVGFRCACYPVSVAQ